MIRPFEKTDIPDLLKLLKLNIPAAFAQSEYDDYVHYLDSEIEDYFVVDVNGRIIGAGGINYNLEKKEAYLSWDFLHPDWQGRGLGKRLALMRLDLIKTKASINKIVVRTSQMAFKFYEKMGFRLKYTSEDFWAKSYDLFYMEIILH